MRFDLVGLLEEHVFIPDVETTAKLDGTSLNVTQSLTDRNVFLETFYRDNYSKLVKSAGYNVKERLPSGFVPEVGLVLGSGWSDLVGNLLDSIVLELNYKDIPFFPKPTVDGHRGKLVFGYIFGVPVAVMEGRKHFYEVGKMKNIAMNIITSPVDILKYLGIKTYFATNAAGGLRPKIKDLSEVLGYSLEVEGQNVADPMLITGHLNLMGDNPLFGDDLKGNFNRRTRFPPLPDAYDRILANILRKVSLENNIHMVEGSYLGVPGPNYETTPEVLAFRQFAHAVGMSTVPEVLVARGLYKDFKSHDRRLNVVALSCLTNQVGIDGQNMTNHLEVLETLALPDVKEKFQILLRGFFQHYVNLSNRYRYLVK